MLHITQLSHLNLCHSELSDVFGIPQNRIFFHEINFLFLHIDNARSGRIDSHFYHLTRGDYNGI